MEDQNKIRVANYDPAVAQELSKQMLENSVATLPSDAHLNYLVFAGDEKIGECADIKFPAGIDAGGDILDLTSIDIAKMEDKKPVIVGHIGHVGYGELSTLINALKEKHKIEVVSVEDTVTLKADFLKYADERVYEIKPAPPTPSFYGEEKKKKKPCTYHEYTQRLVKEEGALKQYEWRCRHCNHPLK